MKRTLVAFFVVFVAGACASSESNTSSSGGTGAAASGGSAGKSGGGSGGSAGSSASGGSSGSSDAASDSSDAAAGSGGSAGSGGGVLEGSADAPNCTPPAPGGNCDTFPQCGCAIGQRCEVIDYSTGRTQCVKEGAVAPYQACGTFGGACSKGNACVGGVCKPFCAIAADCPGADRQCAQVQRDDAGTIVPVPGMFVCTSGCDPVAPAVVCGAGITCAFNSLANNATDCYGAGNGIGDNGCAGSAGCAAGYQCVVSQTGNRDCLTWCRTNNPNDCTDPEVCIGLTGAPSFGGVEYGVCDAPP